MKLTGKSVLVSGGAGFIGSHLVDRIIQESPRELIVVDNLFLGKEENIYHARLAFPDLKFYQQDVSDYEAMKQIIIAGAVEVVFNLAVIPLPASLERPRWTIETNVAIVNVACELLRKGYYQSLIHFSSSEAYGSAQYVPMDEQHPFMPSTPYAASKSAGDQIVLSYYKTFGIDTTILRPFNNFGPRQNDRNHAGIIPIVIQRAMHNIPVTIFGDGEQTRDFVFVRATADAAVRIYEEPATRGKAVNIASGQELSINQLVKDLLQALNSKVPIVYAEPRAGDVRRHCGEIYLAKQLLGYVPVGVTHENLQETVEWYLQR